MLFTHRKNNKSPVLPDPEIARREKVAALSNSIEAIMTQAKEQPHEWYAVTDIDIAALGPLKWGVILPRIKDPMQLESAAYRGLVEDLRQQGAEVQVKSIHIAGSDGCFPISTYYLRIRNQDFRAKFPALKKVLDLLGETDINTRSIK